MSQFIRKDGETSDLKQIKVQYYKDTHITKVCYFMSNLLDEEIINRVENMLDKLTCDMVVFNIEGQKYTRKYE